MLPFTSRKLSVLSWILHAPQSPKPHGDGTPVRPHKVSYKVSYIFLCRPFKFFTTLFFTLFEHWHRRKAGSQHHSFPQEFSGWWRKNEASGWFSLTGISFMSFLQCLLRRCQLSDRNGPFHTTTGLTLLLTSANNQQPMPFDCHANRSYSISMHVTETNVYRLS